MKHMHIEIILLIKELNEKHNFMFTVPGNIKQLAEILQERKENNR